MERGVVLRVASSRSCIARAINPLGTATPDNYTHPTYFLFTSTKKKTHNRKKDNTRRTGS